jgi:iron complex outermembrane recepter protein
MAWNAFRFYGVARLAVICAVGVGGVPDSVHSQEAHDGEVAALEEVVVTARKREENLQSVPVAVTAFSQEALREQNILTPYDLQFATPGLQVRAGANRDTPQYFIRGQGTTYSSAPGVVPYFAEAPLSSTDNFQIYDMESTQVLKGPQGTLFGRSTTGGAILLSPHKPTDQLEGYVDVKYGNYNMHEVEAALNIPVWGDKLDVRLSVDSTRRNGYTTNLVNGEELDNRHRDSFRIGMTFKPFEGFENYALFQDINVNEIGSAAPLAGFNPLLPLFNTTPTGKGYQTIASVCGGLNSGNPAGNASCIASRVALINALVANLTGEAERLQTGGADATRSGQSAITPATISHTQDIHDIATYNVGSIPWLGDTTLKNVLSTTRTLNSFQQYSLGGSAYLHGVSSVGGQNIVNGVLVRDPDVVRNNFFDHYTEEVQVAGAAKSVDWIVGWFDQSDTTRGGEASTFPTFQNAFSPSLTNAVFLNAVAVYAHSQYTNAFGQATEHLGALIPSLDGLNFTAGYAESHLTSRTVNAQAVYTPTGVIPGIPAAPLLLDDTGSSYNFTLDYKITPDLLAYVTTREGFKQGGSNPVPANPIPGSVFTFKPETVKDVEVGSKYTYRLGDMVGRSNLAIYYDWYTSIQRNQILINPNPPFNTQTQVNNIGVARIYGLEWENEARIGRWSLRLNYAGIQADYTSYPGNDTNILGQSVPRITTRYPGTPKFQLTVGARYDVINDAKLGVIAVGAEYYRQSTVELDDDPTNDPYGAGLQGPYGVLNLRIDWTNLASYPVDAAFYVTNATDAAFKTGIKSFIANLGVTSATYSEPRMFGIELRYRFGRTP